MIFVFVWEKFDVFARTAHNNFIVLGFAQNTSYVINIIRCIETFSNQKGMAE